MENRGPVSVFFITKMGERMVARYLGDREFGGGGGGGVGERGKVIEYNIK